MTSSDEDRADRIRSFYEEAWDAGDASPIARNTGLIERMRTEAFDASVRSLLARVERGQLLEIGPGGGRATRRFIEAGFETVAFDISESALRRLPEDCARCGGDAARLPFRDCAFGSVYVGSVLMFLPLATVLDETARVLRPDGYAVFLEPLADNPWMRIYRRITGKYEAIAQWHSLVELEEQMRRRFSSVSVESYYFNVPLAMLPASLARLRGLDRPFARILRRYTWMASFVCREPRTRKS